MSQFEKVMLELKSINFKLDLIAKRIGILSFGDNETLSTTEDLFTDEDEPGVSVRSRQDPSRPRTTVEYKNINGDTKTIEFELLEPKVKEIVRLAQQNPQYPFQLWEAQDATIRVMVANEILSMWNAKHPGPNG